MLRQRRLLALLGALGGPVPNLDFQKLLFLYCQDQDAGPLYGFVPYKFGAFSFTSYADRRKLVAQGLLTDNEFEWQLTSDGMTVAIGEQESSVTHFVTNYRALRGDPLVADTYRRFPYYAIRSELAATILNDDTVALQRIHAARPSAKPGALLTVGYEGRSLESYLNLLLQSGVTVLCDVRRNPLSRKYGFARSTLANACDGLGIRYEHRPELGISSARRWALKSSADYRRLFAEYEQCDLPQQQHAIAEATGWITSGECVALTCYERNAENCHRGLLAEVIGRQTSRQPPTHHL